MNYARLLEMQAELDNHIFVKQKLSSVELPQLVLATITELSEVCNDVQCFKYWKVNNDPKDSLLEEIADFTHFLASLSNRFSITALDIEGQTTFKHPNLNRHLIEMHFVAAMIAIYPSLSEGQRNTLLLWAFFKGLIEQLGFTEKQVFEAYLKKNEKNYERQATGY